MTLTTTDRLEVAHSPADAHPSEADPMSTAQESAATADPVSTRPTFTITDAATACSVSRKTITRKLPELAGHGAAKDDDGVWRIPVEALLAVGLHPGRSLPQVTAAPVRPAPPAASQVRAVDQDTVTIPRDRWDDVRIRLARAEAEAAERGLALADARLALRALTAGPLTPPAAARGAQLPHETRVQTSDEPGSTRPAPAGAGSMGTGSGTIAPRGADQTAVEGSGRSTVQDAAVPGAAVPGSEGPDGPAPHEVESPPADVVAARNLAARTGGYVPAVAAPARKRRWWQSR